MYREVDTIESTEGGFSFDCFFDGKAYETERELEIARDKCGFVLTDLSWTITASTRYGPSNPVSAGIWIASVKGKDRAKVQRFRDCLIAEGWKVREKNDS